MNGGKVIVCEQMDILRKWLNEHGIEWEDNSESWSLDDFGKHYNHFICRTHLHIGDYFVSVINGNGTYGGIVGMSGKNTGLLEIMCDWMPVTGYLAADDVIKILEDKINDDK